MKHVVLYFGFLFIGLPVLMFVGHIATLPNDERQQLSEVVEDLKGHIYTARIDCKGGGEHVLRVHGRSRDDALSKLEAKARRCDVEIIDVDSEAIWKKALRSAF